MVKEMINTSNKIYLSKIQLNPSAPYNAPKTLATKNIIVGLPSNQQDTFHVETNDLNPSSKESLIVKLKDMEIKVLQE